MLKSKNLKRYIEQEALKDLVKINQLNFPFTSIWVETLRNRSEFETKSKKYRGDTENTELDPRLTLSSQCLCGEKNQHVEVFILISIALLYSENTWVIQ